MIDRLELQFLEYKLEPLLHTYSKLIQKNKKRIRLRPFNRFAAEFLSKIPSNDKEAKFYVAKSDCDIPLPQNVALLNEDEPVEVTILFIPEAKKLSSVLMEYVDLKFGIIIAPITEHYYKKKPLFLISIPKSGTHLLYELVQCFGYSPGIVCQDNPLHGHWYCVEYSNSHTSAKDFFIDTVRRRNFGNRNHPFMRSPSIFIYRNPMDILVSEANYYHKDGNTAFYSYLNKDSFEERLLKLIDDPWMFGSIRDRVGNFIPWLDFQNVMPISFEELIGPNGGGSLDAQTKLIWSLQLKLHVPGKPEEFGKRVFNENSATFQEGRIGACREYFTNQARKKFCSLPDDFMKALGYGFDGEKESPKIPNRADEFRKRRVIFSEVEFDNNPITVEYNYLGYNIVKYRGLFYGIPQFLGPLDLTHTEDSELLDYCSSKDVNSVKQKISLGKGMSKTMSGKKYIRKLKELGSVLSWFNKKS